MRAILRALEISATIAVFAFVSTGPGHTFELRCTRSAGERTIPKFDGRTGFPTYETIPNCLRLQISGNFERNDAEKLRIYFEQQRHLLGVTLLSLGGNVREAVEVGRLIRSRLLPVSARPFSELDPKSTPTCGVEGKPVCCASACAIAYFGGAQYFIDDRLGLHRPTLKDLGDIELSQAEKELRDTEALIKTYFNEMEVTNEVFELMMKTPPNSISVWQVDPHEIGRNIYRYPKTIADWLYAKCRRMGNRSRHDCMDEELRKASREKAEDKIPSKNEVRFRSMSKEQLREFLKAKPSAETWLDSNQAKTELGRRRLAEDKEQIDKMTLCEVKSYIDTLFEEKGMREGEYETFERAADRLEELTGDREPWSVKNRTPVSCPFYKSRF